jgi:hypothetical protein
LDTFDKGDAKLCPLVAGKAERDAKDAGLGAADWMVRVERVVSELGRPDSGAVPVGQERQSGRSNPFS